MIRNRTLSQRTVRAPGACRQATGTPVMADLKVNGAGEGNGALRLPAGNATGRGPRTSEFGRARCPRQGCAYGSAPGEPGRFRPAFGSSGASWHCWKIRRSRDCRNWCRSDTAECWLLHSRTSVGRRCQWPAILPPRPRPGWWFRPVVMPTCPTLASSPRRRGNSSSLSTTSTRLCRGRGNGM